MIAAIDRYVKEKCGYSVLKDKDFELSRKVLNGKAVDLQRNGMGRGLESQTHLQCTAQEEELLWEQVLGKDNQISPTALFYFLSVSISVLEVAKSIISLE